MCFMLNLARMKEMGPDSTQQESYSRSEATDLTFLYRSIKHDNLDKF